MPGTPIDFDTSVTYCDRLRIRLPGDSSFQLGEHMDGGSVERKLLIFTLDLDFFFIFHHHVSDESEDAYTK